MISPVVGLIGVLASPALQVSSSEIDAQIQRFVSAVNSNDAAAHAALYIRDPSVTSLGGGHIMVGPSAVAAPTRTGISQLPFFPTIGVEFEF